MSWGVFKALSNISDDPLKSIGSRLLRYEELGTKGPINKELKAIYFAYVFVNLYLIMTIKYNKIVFLYCSNKQKSLFLHEKWEFTSIYVNDLAKLGYQIVSW